MPKAETSNGKTASIARLSTAEDHNKQNNRRKAQNRRIVSMVSERGLKHPDKIEPRAQLSCNGENFHVIHCRQRKNRYREQQKFLLIKLGEFIADKTQNVADKLNRKRP